ncbi:extracellular solute-binding protein [Marinimicrobium sp. ABcell2]|uniref:extracellular solute-binding protein n=1 Tax=Marinimicrobium sp. ABcell2 TaxID=3069751 RepID=UPI0027B5EAB7|nr:extracellular solute-binding protein [Marinimicrobium sp. ABcell2]MDQ2076086.1 extracellular solute-binding protein [Marinimicrobium sp. ABcell2]
MPAQSRFFSRLGLSVACAVGAFMTLGCGEKSARDDVITVYSARAEHLISPLFDRYTEETGIEIRYITDNAGALIQRLKAEGGNTPADILLTVDAGNLWQASQEGLFQPLDSEIIEAHIPAHRRADNGDWTGLSVRARTLVYSTARVDPSELSTYEALAEPQWEGRLCLRTSKKVYNQSLVATMINTLGEDETENIVRGWVSNLATDPFANDTATMEAIAAGQCDVAIVNTYYFGRLQRSNPEIPLALFWPNQDGRGVHINVSGGGITRHAKNPDGARALLEWLAGEQAQYQFAEVNQEYPANPRVDVSEEVAAWGDFRADDVNVEVAGRLQSDAIRLMDRARYR